MIDQPLKLLINGDIQDTEISMKFHFVHRCTLSSADCKFLLKNSPTSQLFTWETVKIDYNKEIKKREFKEENSEKIPNKKKKQ
jgi:hypothetical protein